MTFLCTVYFIIDSFRLHNTYYHAVTEELIDQGSQCMGEYTIRLVVRLSQESHC